MNDIEKYYEQYQIYQKYLEENKTVEKDLLESSKALSQAQKELAQYEARLNKEKKVKLPDFHSGVKEFTSVANQKIDALETQYNKTIKQLKADVTKQITANRDSYTSELEKIKGLEWDVDRALTEDEENCLEYTKRKKELEEECTSDIRALKNALEKEKLNCQKDVNAYVVQQQKNTESYNARISSQQSKIDDISDKYTEPIARFDTALNHEVERAKNVLAEIQKKMDERNEAFTEEQAELEDRLTSIKRSYAVKSVQAKLSGNETDDLASAKDMKVNTIQSSLEVSKKNYDADFDVLQKDYDEKKQEMEAKVTAARKKADIAAAQRAEELAEPQMLLETLKSEKEQRLSQLERLIQQRQSQSEQLIKRYEAEIKSKETYRASEEKKLENELKQYAEMTNNGFDEVFTSANAIFIPVEEKKDLYQTAVRSLSKNVSAQKAQDVYNNAYQDLAEETYEELKESAEECLNLEEEISSLYVNSVPVYVIACLVGILFGVGLYFGAHLMLIISIAVALIIIGILIFGYRYLLVQKLYIYEKALALASEYRNMNAIRSYSSSQAVNAESKRVQNLGETIYNVKYGEERSYRVHQENEEYIKKEYENALLAAQENAVGQNNVILKERDDAVDAYRLKCRSNLEQHRNSIDALTRKAIFAEQRCKTLNRKVNALSNEKQELDHWYNGYEDYCRSLHYNDFEGKAGDKLSDTLYIIPEDSNAINEKTSSEPRRVTKLNFDEKPVVVLYDRDLIQSYVGEEKEDARRRTIEDILKTMLYAVKRVNPKGLFKQYVCNDPMVPDSFDNDEAKKNMEIKSVVKGIDALVEAMSKNKTMVTFVHIVVEPNSDAFDVSVFKNVYPFYICEKNEWLNGISEGESIYSSIKETTDNSCILEYDNGKIVFNSAK